MSSNGINLILEALLESSGSRAVSSCSIESGSVSRADAILKSGQLRLAQSLLLLLKSTVVVVLSCFLCSDCGSKISVRIGELTSHSSCVCGDPAWVREVDEISLKGSDVAGEVSLNCGISLCKKISLLLLDFSSLASTETDDVGV